jgi:predicted Zn-dependent protease
MPGQHERDALYDDASGDVAIGDLEAAAQKYRRCVEIDPDFFDGWHALGMALFKSGNSREAIGATLMATQLEPNDQLAWTALSQMYVAQGKIAEAEEAKSNATILGLGGKVVKDADRT